MRLKDWLRKNLSILREKAKWAIFTGLVQSAVRQLSHLLGWPMAIATFILVGGGAVADFILGIPSEWVWFATILVGAIMVPRAISATAELRKASAEEIRASNARLKLDQAERGLRGPEALEDKTKKATEPTAEPEILGMTAWEAVDYIIDRSEFGQTLAHVTYLLAACMEFDKAAGQGKIRVEGREKFTADTVEIPHTYWRIGGLNSIKYIKYRERKDSTIRRPRGAGGETEQKDAGVAQSQFKVFEDLHVSEDEIMSEWPPTAESTDDEVITVLEDMYSEGDNLLERGSTDPNEWRMSIINWFERAEEILNENAPRDEAFMFRTHGSRPKPDEKFDDCPALLRKRLHKLRLIIGRLHAGKGG